jgi:hypothetical protein
VLTPGTNVEISLFIGVVIFLLATATAILVRKNKDQTVKEWLSISICAGTRNLRSTFKLSPSPSDTNIHIATFDICIKYVCFPVLLGLFVNQAVSTSSEYDRGYKDYPAWVQAMVGVGVLGMFVVAFVSFTIWPGLWDRISGNDEDLDEATLFGQAMHAMVCHSPLPSASKEIGPMMSPGADQDGKDMILSTGALYFGLTRNGKEAV